MTTTSTDNSSYLESYRQQIDQLEKDPNATAAYDQGLEQQFAAVKAQLMGGDEGAPASGQPQPPDSSDGGPVKTGTPPDTPSPSSNPDNSAPPVAGGPPVSGSGNLNTSNLPSALNSLAPDILAASKATGVDPNLLAAQIWQESRGDVGATSTNPGNAETDTGLMQINPSTYAQLQKEHPELQGKSLSDPANNIMAGAYLMKDLLQQYGGNTGEALRAYNSGDVDPSNVNIAPGGIGDPNYVTSVDGILSDIQSGRNLPA